MIVSWNVWSPPKAAWSAWKSFPVILSQILSGSAGQSPSVNCVLRNNRFPRSSIPSSASNARWRRRRMRSAKLSGSTLARLAQLAKSAVRRTCGNGSLTLPRSMVANARKTLELAKPLALNVGRHRMSQKHFVGCCTCLWLHCPAPWLFLYTTCIYIYTTYLYKYTTCKLYKQTYHAIKLVDVCKSPAKCIFNRFSCTTPSFRHRQEDGSGNARSGQKSQLVDEGHQSWHFWYLCPGENQQNRDSAWIPAALGGPRRCHQGLAWGRADMEQHGTRRSFRASTLWLLPRQFHPRSQRAGCEEASTAISIWWNPRCRPQEGNAFFFGTLDNATASRFCKQPPLGPCSRWWCDSRYCLDHLLISTFGGLGVTHGTLLDLPLG